MGEGARVARGGGDIEAEGNLGRAPAASHRAIADRGRGDAPGRGSVDASTTADGALSEFELRLLYHGHREGARGNLKNCLLAIDIMSLKCTASDIEN